MIMFHDYGYANGDEDEDNDDDPLLCCIEILEIVCLFF